MEALAGSCLQIWLCTPVSVVCFLISTSFLHFHLSSFSLAPSSASRAQTPPWSIQLYSPLSLPTPTPLSTFVAAWLGLLLTPAQTAERVLGVERRESLQTTLELGSSSSGSSGPMSSCLHVMINLNFFFSSLHGGNILTEMSVIPHASLLFSWYGITH